MKNFKKLIFLLFIFINCKTNLNNNNFKPCLKTDYLNYIKLNNLSGDFYDNMIFCTSKFLKQNDFFDKKIFIFPFKFTTNGDSGRQKIVLYEFNKNKILRSYLYPSRESENFFNKSFETGYEKSTDSTDLSKFLPPNSNAPKQFIKKFVPPDSFVLGILPYYDSSVFNKSIILNNAELDSLNLNIFKILLDTNVSVRSSDSNFKYSNNLNYEYFDDVYVFQIKKDSRFIQIDIAKAALMKYFQEIFKILDEKFNK